MISHYVALCNRIYAVSITHLLIFMQYFKKSHKYNRNLFVCVKNLEIEIGYIIKMR